MSSPKRLSTFPVLKLLSIFLCFAQITSSSNNSTNSSSSIETKNEAATKSLIDELLKNYDVDARPVIHANDPLYVKLGLNIHQIVNLDMNNQILTSYVWISLEWTDLMLRWDPKDFDNVSDIRMPTTRVWTPDLELYNGADELVSLSDGRTPLVVKNNGSVSWIEPKEFRSFCPLDITYFPFDQQTCKVKMGSWSHHGFQMDLSIGKHKVVLHETASLGKWWVLKSDMERTAKFYPCCPEPYIDLTMTLVLKRKPMHYVCDTIIPCLLLSVVAIVTLTMSPECWMRLAMQVLILFGFAFYVWNYTGAYLTNSTSIFLLYLMLMMIHAFLAIVFTILILKLYNIGKEPNTRPLPNCLKFILLSDKNTLLKTMNIVKRNNDQSHIVAPYGDRNNTVRDDIPLTQCAFTESIVNQDEERFPNNVGTVPSQPTASVDLQTTTDEFRHNVSYFGDRYLAGAPVYNNTISVMDNNSQRIPQANCQSTSQYQNRRMTSPHDDGEHRKSESILSAEWILLAQKMDRICFWIITVTTILINFLLFILFW